MTEHEDDGRLVYEPDGKVLAEYVADRSKVAVICGPIGSGTSSASIMRLFMTACEQRPATRGLYKGLRRTRVGVIRTTYPELQSSTLTSWRKWLPEEIYGPIKVSRPMHQVIRFGDVEIDVWFLALDDEMDIKKLRSTEFTMLWFNELEYHSYVMFSEAHSRVAQGRFPPLDEGGPTWHGLIGDMNAPREDHFIAQMAGWAPYPDDVPEEKRIQWPKGWWLKKQPPGLIEVFSPDGKAVTGYVENPEAENRRWLKEGYLEVIKGKEKSFIDNRVMNRIGLLTAGDPVWPGFKPDLHMTDRELPYVPGREVNVAMDFGRRPAALISQEIGDRVQIQREVRMYGVGSSVFAPRLKRFLEQNYRGATVRFTGDPKGRDRGQAEEKTSYEIFAGYGMNITPAPVRNNNLGDRLEAVSYALLTNRILVSRPGCQTLAAAMSGKYVWKKLDTGDAEPLKDKYSDVADCLQYLCLFLGEGRRMVGLDSGPQPQPTRIVQMRRSLRRVPA